MLKFLCFLSALAYVIATFSLWRYTFGKPQNRPRQRAMIISITTTAVALHGALLYFNSVAFLGFNLSLAAAFSVVAFWAVILFVLMSLFRATLTLGLAVLPLAVLAVLAGYGLNSTNSTALAQHVLLNKHLLFAVITFALLSLAAAQAAIMLLQEHNIKQPHTHSSFSLPYDALPPLQSMDSQLFQLLLMGFIMLCASLVFGIAANLNLHQQILVFNHHIILTLLASIGFASLLIFRVVRGIRGRKAAQMTLMAYGLFVLGYFGTRFVREIILS